MPRVLTPSHEERMEPTTAAAWIPTLGELAQDKMAMGMAAKAALTAAVAAIAGASVEAVLSVSFGILTLVVFIDMLAGLLATAVADWRAYEWRVYTGARGYKSTLKWTRLLGTPLKWIAYALVTWAVGLLLLAITVTGIRVAGVWAVACMHVVFIVHEVLSVVAHASTVVPRIRTGFAAMVERINPAAAELIRSGPVAWREEAVRFEEEQRRGSPPAPTQGTVRTRVQGGDT